MAVGVGRSSYFPWRVAAARSAISSKVPASRFRIAARRPDEGDQRENGTP